MQRLFRRLICRRRRSYFFRRNDWRAHRRHGFVTLRRYGRDGGGYGNRSFRGDGRSRRCRRFAGCFLRRRRFMRRSTQLWSRPRFGFKNWDFAFNGRQRRRRARRRGRRTALLLQELHDLIAHLRLNGTELVLDIDAVLLAQNKKILALHAQLSRQSENANFLFNLQAELPVRTNLAYPLLLQFSLSFPYRDAWGFFPRSTP